MATAVYGVGQYGVDTYDAGQDAAVHPGGLAHLLWQSGGVDVAGCITRDAAATVALAWADAWYQRATVTAPFRGTSLPAGMARGDVVTLRQTDAGGTYAGPFGRYRVAGFAGPARGTDHQRYTHVLAHDWLWPAIQRVYTTSGIAGVNAPAALIQLIDMLRGTLDGPIAPNPDAITWADTTFGTTDWWATWEGTVAVCLYWLTGSVPGTEWLTVEGDLADLTTALRTIVERTDVVTGLPLPRWDLWSRMAYDPGVTWYQLLTEICAPKRAGHTSYGVPPMTLTMDAAGGWHLRREGARWTQGWGWKPASDSSHVVGRYLPLRAPYSAAPAEPAVDHVVVTMYFLQVSGAALLIVGDAKAFTGWYTWDATLERRLLEPLSVGGIVGQENSLNPSLATVTAAQQYCQRIASGLLTRALGDAWTVQPLQLAGAWDWPELGQDLAFYDVADVAEVLTLAQATVPLDGSGASWQARWRADG